MILDLSATMPSLLSGDNTRFTLVRVDRLHPPNRAFHLTSKNLVIRVGWDACGSTAPGFISNTGVGLSKEEAKAKNRLVGRPRVLFITSRGT